jgi:protease II
VFADVFVDSSSKMTTEVWYIRTADDAKADGAAVSPSKSASGPLVGPRVHLFSKRVHEHLYSVDHSGDWFYVVTNSSAKNFKLIRCPVSNTDPSAWQTIIAHDPARKIDETHAFRNHIVVVGRRNGFSDVSILTIPPKAGAGAAAPAADAKQPADQKNAPGAGAAAGPALGYAERNLAFPETIFTCEVCAASGSVHHARSPALAASAKDE